MALFHSERGSNNYTIIGSPTIIDGVVSGFSENDKLNLPALSATGGNPFEMQFAFISKTTTVNGLLILYGGSSNTTRFGVYSSNRPAFLFHIVGGSASAYQQIAFDTVTSMNTKYIAKAVYDGATVNCYLYDGSGTLLETKSATGSFDIEWGNACNIGASATTAYDGIVDLNNTYIKINGDAWFGICPVEVKKHQIRGPIEYTIEGSPTVVNGIASGFSDSNYLATSSVLPQLLNDFEMVTKVNFGSSLSGNQQIMGSIYLGFWIMSNNERIKIYASTNGTSWNGVNGVLGIHSFSANDIIWIKAVKDSTSLKIYYSTDKENWVLDNSFEVTDPIKIRNDYSVCGFGSNTANYFNGSIDMNETYIKINGKLWFWKPQETKYIIKDDKLVWANPDIYLQSDGNQWIDTGISGVSSFHIDAKGILDDEVSQIVLGRNNAGASYFGKFQNLGVWGLGSGTAANFNLSYLTRQKVIVNFLDNGISAICNGVTKTRTETSSPTGRYIYMFGANENDKYCASCNIYSCSCFQDGIKIREFVPVPQGLQIGSFTVPSNGMFDIVNQQFYENKGTGTFVMGKDN